MRARSLREIACCNTASTASGISAWQHEKQRSAISLSSGRPNQTRPTSTGVENNQCITGRFKSDDQGKVTPSTSQRGLTTRGGGRKRKAGVSVNGAAARWEIRSPQPQSVLRRRRRKRETLRHRHTSKEKTIAERQPLKTTLKRQVTVHLQKEGQEEPLSLQTNELRTLNQLISHCKY
jgi:hypothetical protein